MGPSGRIKGLIAMPRPNFSQSLNIEIVAATGRYLPSQSEADGWTCGKVLMHHRFARAVRARRSIRPTGGIHVSHPGLNPLLPLPRPVGNGKLQRLGALCMGYGVSRRDRGEEARSSAGLSECFVCGPATATDDERARNGHPAPSSIPRPGAVSPGPEQNGM